MESLRCNDCRVDFSTKHAAQVHFKSMSHARRLEEQEERRRRRLSLENKEKRQAAFEERYRDVLLPLWEKYCTSSQATLGELHGPCEVRTGATLSESIELLYSCRRPRPHVQSRRKALYVFVFKVCRAMFPECELDVYGSIPHAIDEESSDIDMSIRVANVSDAHLLDMVARGIELVSASHVCLVRVLHARIPVISVVDSLTETHLDLSIWNVDKKHISKVFQWYFEFDPLIRPLVFVVRRFSKVHHINDAYSGYVNSFGWTVAVICFLLHQKLVPLVAVDDELTVHKVEDAAEPRSLAQLLEGFFSWFLKWNIETHRLTMREPHGLAPKESNKFEDYTYVCIERPQTPWQNICRQVEKKQWQKIRAHVREALEQVREGRLVAL